MLFTTVNSLLTLRLFFEVLLTNTSKLYRNGSETLDRLRLRGEQLSPLSWRDKRTLAERLVGLFYFFQIFMGIWGYLLSFYLSWRLGWPFLAIFIPYMVYIFGPGLKYSREGTYPTPLRRMGIWKVLAGYYPARIHKTADLDPSQSYIFAFHPHSIMPVSAFLTFCTTATGFYKMFPGLDVRLLTLSLNFHGPILREWLLLHGFCDVTRSTCARLLNKGKSIAIVVGGGTESLYCCPKTHDIILNRRKGFIKVALQTGASLVPVYSFGETNVYSTLNCLSWNSPIRRFQRAMQKAWGWTWPIAWGTGVFLPWGVLAYPVPIDTVIGRPLTVPKYEGDTDSAEFRALVDKYHALYTQALVELFREHKEKFAPGEQELRIVE